MTFYQPGGLDHSVFDTFVQLTEGRSARDQPKQPPAKKTRTKAKTKARTKAKTKARRKDKDKGNFPHKGAEGPEQHQGKDHGKYKARAEALLKARTFEPLNLS